MGPDGGKDQIACALFNRWTGEQGKPLDCKMKKKLRKTRKTEDKNKSATIKPKSYHIKNYLIEISHCYVLPRR